MTSQRDLTARTGLAVPMSGAAPGAVPRPNGTGSARRLTADERRRQLFTVALNLFAERGFRSTTMDDIAEVAGVTKPLVYQHFSSKRALYLELVDSVAKELVAAIGEAVAHAPGPRQQVEMGFAAYFDMVVTHEAAFRLLYGRNYDDELGEALRRVEDAIAAAIEPLIAAGLDDGHRRFLAHAVVGMAEGASRCWITGRGGQAPQGAADGTGEDDPIARRLAGRLADLAWAGLRSVHAD
ncbi:MAG: TetR/AcrR family transcriptional regulator [Acidimicrobiales bacterium]